jgi:ribosomal protein S3
MEKLEIISETEKIILREIAYLYSPNTYRLGIKRIVFEDNIVKILLDRPGILIGKKGRDINTLLEILKKKLENQDLKIHIEESSIDSYFIDYDEI